MVGVSYQRAPFLAGSGSGSEYFCIIGGNRATIQSKTSLSNSGGVAGYTPAYIHLQNTKHPSRWPWVKP